MVHLTNYDRLMFFFFYFHPELEDALIRGHENRSN
jgi:hypothetical protein